MGELTGSEGALGERIVEELQRRIITGQIPVGTWLRHGAIADEFGTSRTPVREALRVLHAQGIVTIVQNRGARVNGHSGRDIRDIGQVRAELEGLAAELAATRMDDEQQDRMVLAVRDFEAAIEDYKLDRGKMFKPEAAQRWREANEAFHGSIVAASGNPQIVASIADLSRRLPRNLSYSAYAGNTRALIQNLREHDAVAQAIMGKDGRAARRLMVKHVVASVEATARWTEDNKTLRQDDAL
jgi:DNA-binding GntR family transcriptional regulator